MSASSTAPPPRGIGDGWRSKTGPSCGWTRRRLQPRQHGNWWTETTAVSPPASSTSTPTAIPPSRNTRWRRAASSRASPRRSAETADSPWRPVSLDPEKKKQLRDYVGDLDYTWESVGGYLDFLEARGTSVNFGTAVGHGTIRLAVMGFEAVRPLPRSWTPWAGCCGSPCGTVRSVFPAD